MRVGSEIGSNGSRCGDVWHVVIARVDGRIAKVECKECGARHRDRSAEGAKTAPSRASAAGATSPRTRSRQAKPIGEADRSRSRRPFRPGETFRVGDRVVHASIGEGVVQAVKGPTKIEILFEVGCKTRVHGRDGS